MRFRGLLVRGGERGGEVSNGERDGDFWGS